MGKNNAFDSDTIKEQQEKMRKLAQESWELREGYSIRELVENANRQRRAENGCD